MSTAENFIQSRASRFMQIFTQEGKPASMAQLDAHPTSDQEVAVSILPPPHPRSATFFRGDSIMKYFLSLPFKKGSCKFLAKECAQY